MRRVAIITARGGSKRIPRKNIKLFLGKPMIQYSIEAALEAGIFDEVMVSTDDEEIAELAVKCGGEVPFFRSARTSDDYATTADVVLEVLFMYEQRGRTFDSVCCIYPTAPLITAERLRQAMELMEEKDAESILPVVRFSFPPQRSVIINDKILRPKWPECMKARSQDLEPFYHDAGQFYCLDVLAFLQQKRMVMGYTLPLILPEMSVQDIDTEEDWKIAELKYRMQQEGMENA